MQKLHSGSKKVVQSGEGRNGWGVVKWEYEFEEFGGESSLL